MQFFDTVIVDEKGVNDEKQGDSVFPYSTTRSLLHLNIKILYMEYLCTHEDYDLRSSDDL